ncbi:hypothetical protein GCM10023084_81190 [Streptomyces lacrimifluminis]|uniref:Uncharacterized protein n=1 Tax=Streptomyces lacrimifluminis TaxID=1500077 RepID=A0A917UP57_9ACTN|nr:hypothetical protein [Streptomyces lacrimifluminis]GGJ71256.1 hypothetical protein GCM10012282_80120 [Streptomyces lacrimifluminis]
MHDAWKVLHEGRRGDVCLAVDYDVTGRIEARFSDLFAQLAAVSPMPLPSVFEALQPPLGDERGMSGADYVHRWVDSVREADWEVTSVLGFCAGGTFAAGIADELERLQGAPPKLILFDPETPDALTLYYHFHKVVGGLAAGLPEERVAAAQEAGRLVTESGMPLADIASELTAAFQGLVPIAFEAAGLDESFADELSLTYSSFLTYLIGAGDIDHRNAWRKSTVVSSRSPLSGLNRYTPEERDAMVAEEIKCDLEHIDLLRDLEAASILRELLK